MTIRVLIIDGSPTVRAMLVARLSGKSDIEVVAAARDPVEARELIRALEPDVATLDIDTPAMNGLELLEKIMRLRPTPVIVVSSLGPDASNGPARALALGATDCYARSDEAGSLRDDGGRLAQLVRQAAKTRPRQRGASPAAPNDRGDPARPALIAIGGSTGGVEALQAVLSKFQRDCPPTVIVQHVHNRFAPAIARTLDAVSPADVILAEDNMVLEPGRIHLAPGGEAHLTVAGEGDTYLARLRPGFRVSGHVPSVDILFESVARRVAARAVGVLLTGMGADGARGLQMMAQAGAFTIAQDEATCTAFGMPRAAIALGAAALVAPLEQIAGATLGHGG